MKLRYSRTFKEAMVGILIGVLLFGSVLVLSIVARVLYSNLTANMKPVEATVIDIDLDIHVRGPNEQEVTVSYVVDGVAYSQELDTDTAVSFSPGTGAHYALGDKLQIFYDPQDPEVIAAPRSVGVGYFYMVISLIGLSLVLLALFYVMKHRRKFLVTQEEYEKEKVERKKSKAKRKEQERQKNAKARRVFRIIGIVLGVLVGAFALFLLFGAFLMALGY